MIMVDKNYPPAEQRPELKHIPAELLIDIFTFVNYVADLAPLKLAAVCKRWRKIVQTSPPVWQYICLDSGEHTISVLRKQADVWLERSAPLPIDIALQVDTPDAILPLLSPLLPHVNRWRSFDCSGYKEEEHTFPPEWPISCEVLDYLHIYVQEEGGIAPKQTFSSAPPCNYVMNVWLSNLPRSLDLTPLHFTSITITEDTISDFHTPPGALLDFLRACPNLDTFYFSGWPYNSEPPPERYPVVSLPHLHTLHLKQTCLARDILSSLHAPQLVNLFLAHLNVEFTLLGEYTEDGDSDDEAGDFSQSPSSDRATGMGLRKLISRSNPPLRTLEMDFSDMRTKDFEFVFNRLPLLEEFLIVASDLSDKVMALLRPYKDRGGDSVPRVRLPCLRSLKLFNCQQISGDAVVESLSARVGFTDSSSGLDTLEQIVIAGCDGFSFRHALELRNAVGPRFMHQ